MNINDQSVARPSDEKVCLAGRDEYKISEINNVNESFELRCHEMIRNDQSVARPSDGNVAGVPQTDMYLAGRDEYLISETMNVN